MTKQLWFKVPLCRKCWDRVMPDRNPVYALIKDKCVKCDATTTETIYVRVGWPTKKEQ